MNFKLERGIPLPRAPRGSVAKTQYPLSTMGKGSMFRLPLSAQKQVASAACHLTKKLRKEAAASAASGVHVQVKKFTVQRIDDQTAGCWRIS